MRFWLNMLISVYIDTAVITKCAGLFDVFRVNTVQLNTCCSLRYLLGLKHTQSQMSLVVSDIVLKNKFAIKRYETILYTCNI